MASSCSPAGLANLANPDTVSDHPFAAPPAISAIQNQTVAAPLDDDQAAVDVTVSAYLKSPSVVVGQLGKSLPSQSY
jgi:hypothetical protein